MELNLIKTKKDYEDCLKWVDKMFDKKVEIDSLEGEKLQIVLLLIKQYEDKNYPITIPDPIEAITMKMAEKGLKNKDLVGKVGSKGYVSALLNRRKPMTLKLAKIFHHELGIPSDLLLA